MQVDTMRKSRHIKVENRRKMSHFINAIYQWDILGYLMYIYIWIFSDSKKSSKQKCLVRVIEYAKQAVNFTTFKSWSRCMCLHLRKTTRTRVLPTVVTIGIRKTKKTKFCISLDGVAWLKLCCLFSGSFPGSFSYTIISQEENDASVAPKQIMTQKFQFYLLFLVRQLFTCDKYQFFLFCKLKLAKEVCFLIQSNK